MARPVSFTKPISNGGTIDFTYAGADKSTVRYLISYREPDDSAAFGDALARAVKRAIADAYFDAACAYIEPGDPGLRYEAR